jgi:hypothetical protein
MRRMLFLRSVLVFLLVALAILACGPSEPPPEPTEPPAEARAPSPCGDGVCDEVEQKNPNLCPQDCPPTEEATMAPTEPPPTDTPQPEPTVPPDKCGDGVCDEVEAGDPSACPQDCATPEPAITVEVTEAPTALPSPTPTEAVEGRASTTTATGEFAFVGDMTTVTQQDAEAAEQPQSNVALILDGSGSMGEDLPGTGKTKLAVAKEVMADLIPQIPAELNSTLWIYAHRYPPEPKSESCKDIEEVFPLGPVDAQAYVDMIQGIQANGWTPIADSIIAAAGSLPTGDFNSIILVSDGEETCGGDPCAVAEALKDSDVELTVHVVGYGVDDATRQQLECIARVSGGSYHDATDAEGLLRALEEALEAAIVETVLRVEIVDPGGMEVEEPLWLYQAGTDQFVTSYSAWQDNLVPPGSYDLLVFTVPKVLYPDLTLAEGSTTVVRIVLGAVGIVTPGGEPHAGEFFDPGTGQYLGSYSHDGPAPFLPGTYYAAVNWSRSAPIVVEAGETQELVLGAISLLAPDGQPHAGEFFDASTDEYLGSYAHDGPALLLPGAYYVTVNGSRSAPISLEPGATEELVLGVASVFAAGGEPHAAEFFDATTDAYLGRYGPDEPAMLVPGTYYVTVNGSVGPPVTVESGQTTEMVLGRISLLGPGPEPVGGEFYDATNDRYLGSYGQEGPVSLVPGTYYATLSGSVSEPITVESAETSELLVGAVHHDGRYGLRAGADWLGSYDGTAYLVPGTYTVEPDGADAVEVVVVAGQVTEVK